MSSPEEPLQLTWYTNPKGDHYNPFVMDGGKYIAYHRCKSDHLKHGDDAPRHLNKLHSPHEDVGLFRVAGAFPAFSKDGSKLAFVDNEFKAAWLADSDGLHVVFEMGGPDEIFSPVWIKRRIYCLCIWDRLSKPMKLWRSMPSPTYRVVHGRPHTIHRYGPATRR